MPLELVVGVKIVAHWTTAALPLVIATPLLGLLLNLEPSSYVPLITAMALGSPAISAIGAIGAALTLATRKGGLLIALLVLPLYVPTLVFGVSAVDASLGTAGGATAPLLILAAISLVSLILSPIAAAAALRVHSGGEARHQGALRCRYSNAASATTAAPSSQCHVRVSPARA